MSTTSGTTTSGVVQIPPIGSNFALDDSSTFTFSVNDPGKCQIANFTPPTLVDAGKPIVLAWDVVNNRVSPATIITQIVLDGNAVVQSAPTIIAAGATIHNTDSSLSESNIGGSHTAVLQVYRQVA